MLIFVKITLKFFVNIINTTLNIIVNILKKIFIINKYNIKVWYNKIKYKKFILFLFLLVVNQIFYFLLYYWLSEHVAFVHIPKNPGFYPGAPFDPAFFLDADNKYIDLNLVYLVFYLLDTLLITCHISSHHDILFIDYWLKFKLEYYDINRLYISNFRFTYFNFNLLILFLYVIIAFSNMLLKIIFMLTIYRKQTKKEWKRKIKKNGYGIIVN